MPYHRSYWRLHSLQSCRWAHLFCPYILLVLQPVSSSSFSEEALVGARWKTYVTRQACQSRLKRALTARFPFRRFVIHVVLSGALIQPRGARLASSYSCSPSELRQTELGMQSIVWISRCVPLPDLTLPPACHSASRSDLPANTVTLPDLTPLCPHLPFVLHCDLLSMRVVHH